MTDDIVTPSKEIETERTYNIIRRLNEEIARLRAHIELLRADINRLTNWGEENQKHDKSSD